jgi:hypothetical protein
MNDTTPERFYMAVFALFIVAMGVGCFLFFMGMREATYLVSDGLNHTLHYLNKPRYDSNLQGFIFALTFLGAGMLLVLVVMLPNRDGAGAPYIGPPQPRQRAAQPVAPLAAPQAAPAPQADTSLSRMQAQLDPAATPGLEPMAQAAREAPSARPQPAAPAPAQPERSVDEEVLRDVATADDLPALETRDSRLDDAGEDDVVYGTGRITDDSIWEFIQSYPDSAVKFLYRKSLDNKQLSPSDEDIYRRWDLRGMSRAKVRQIVLDIMQWKTLPDDYPHNIWRELRDQIFEMRAR